MCSTAALSRIDIVVGVVCACIGRVVCVSEN